MTKNKDKKKDTKQGQERFVGQKIKQSLYKNTISFFKKYFRVFEFFAIIIAVVSFVFTAWFSRLHYNEWHLESDTRAGERDIRAWQLLTTRALGNNGKKDALEYLASRGKILDGVDFSCKTNGSEWDDNKKICLSGAVYLRRLHLGKKIRSKYTSLKFAKFDGANLSRANFIIADLSNASFEGADLTHAKFNGAILYMAKFSNTKLWNSNFRDADLIYANFSGATLYQSWFLNSDLTSTIFDGAKLDEVYFMHTEMTDAKFDKAQGITPEQLSKGWVWADMADDLLPSIPKDWKQKSAREIIFFCDPKIRKRYYSDIRKIKRRRGLPDWEKCKYWNDWDEEKRKSWLENPKTL